MVVKVYRGVGEVGGVCVGGGRQRLILKAIKEHTDRNTARTEGGGGREGKSVFVLEGDEGLILNTDPDTLRGEGKGEGRGGGNGGRGGGGGGGGVGGGRGGRGGGEDIQEEVEEMEEGEMGEMGEEEEVVEKVYRRRWRRRWKSRVRRRRRRRWW